MSDFDAEAERKRLREQYERDEERRKETQQMSELLLKGATMTNRHCNDCGSPIFRYQGQEFCPSCQRAAAEGQAAEATQANGQQQTGDAGAPAAEAEPAQAAAERPTASSSAGQSEQSEQAEPSPATDASGAASLKEAGATDQPVSPSAPSSTPSTGSNEAPNAADSEARTALLRALTRHARLAEETTDPRQAKAHLAAAREAAAALDELE